jgi:hypothetical protein
LHRRTKQNALIFLNETAQLGHKREILPRVLAFCLGKYPPVLADHVLVQDLRVLGRDTAQLQILMERLLYALIQLTASANQQILAVSKQVTQAFSYYRKSKMSKGARLKID